MAEEEEVADDVKPASGDKTKLILILILANLVMLGGIGAYLVLFSDSGDAEAQPDPDPETYGPLVELPTIIVNLAGQRWGRFMRVSMHIEARTEEQKLLAEAALVPIQNRMVIFFSELDPERTGEEGAKDEISEEIRLLINEVIGDDAIRRVFYTEFVIQ